jgi:hypothetical protein
MSYWTEEAQLGASWIREDGGECPCGGGGWLLTATDYWVECSCGAKGPHPEDRDFDE